MIPDDQTAFTASPDMKARTHCPTCGTILELTLRCKSVAVVGQQGESPVPTPVETRRGTEAEQDVLAAARRAGLLEPFAKTVDFVHRGYAAKDLDTFFLTFVRGLTQRKIPQYAMTAFNALFDHRPLEYHTCQGIGVVVIDGYMRLFVPNSQIVGTRLKKLNSHDGGGIKRHLKIDDGTEKLREWIHTRWGYVAGPGALFETLHNRSFGDFARPNLSAPGPHNT